MRSNSKWDAMKFFIDCNQEDDEKEETSTFFAILKEAQQ